MRRSRSLFWSPIARRILASNLAGLVILIVGALVLNELRSSLVEARVEWLTQQGEFTASVISEFATVGEPRPSLLDSDARGLLKRTPVQATARIRIHRPDLSVAADTNLLYDRIDAQTMPPIKPSALESGWLDFLHLLKGLRGRIVPSRLQGVTETRSLRQEIAIAMEGYRARSERFGDRGERVISVSVPIRRVGLVVGVLTIESSDVNDIIAAERLALLPFILVAVLVAIMTSAMMTLVIGRPLRRLALASDRVRTGAAERLNLGALHDRRDEIGDLARAMEAMTVTLYDRIQSNERFAADVAHELKNPLTSIRAAVETARAVKDPAVRDRMQDVIAADVVRLDRLITDISNLSRLEGEIVREKLVRVDLGRLFQDLASIYADTRREGESQVALNTDASLGPYAVMGREGPLAQVIRNLIENARSFSPPSGEVRIGLSRTSTLNGPVVRFIVDDDGPGVPPDKLEKIFERFYSDRPEGAKFGNNSGLGLSIVKQIVETHRGRVWAENRTENGRIVGARFVVELPPAPASA